MKILLTGGSGFLGKAVLTALRVKNVSIYNLVRQSRNLENEILWDFASPLPTLPSVDAVLHLAAEVAFSNETSKVFVNNAVPALYLSIWCDNNNVPIYFSSTAAVHGVHQPWSSTSLLEPENYYTQGKLAAESIFSNLVGCGHVFFRLSGIYGVGGPYHLGINKAIDDALCGKPPVLFGAGNGLRNYINVNDAANWIADVVHERVHISQIIYMAGKDFFSIRQWLQNIVDVLLPGQNVIEKNGNASSSDVIVIASPTKTPICSFKEYLASIKGTI